MPNTARTYDRSQRAQRPPSYANPPEMTGLDPRDQLKAWLKVLDAVLVAVESTAWQAREIGARTRDAVQGVQGGLGRVVAGGRAFANELSNWPERLKRITVTGFALTRIAASYRLHTTKAAFLSKARAARALDALHAVNAQRFYDLSIRQGGAFLKVGQMLSARPDLLPAAWVSELSRLQDQAPEVSFEDIKRVIERELNGPLEQHFERFDERPLAAASIGQVHRAALHDGREVAVKVQRPDIDELVALDMELLELFVRSLAEGLPPLDFDTIVAEVRDMIAAELDYPREAASTTRVASFFANDRAIHAPEIISEYSTARVITTTFMTGEKITTVLDRLREAREAGDESAQGKITRLLANVMEAYGRMILELGFFQADPHPGNLLASEDGDLVVLDFGCSREISLQKRRALLALVAAFMAHDVQAMALAMRGLDFETDSGSLAGLEQYAQLVLDELEKAKNKGGDWPSQADVLAHMTLMARAIEDDPISKLPAEFVMLGRVIGTLAGLFLHYRPDLGAETRLVPIVMQAMAMTR